jgi:transposase-like protein
MTTISYAGYRFPRQIIQHAVWLYLCFTLSYRNVEELLAERRIDVSHEAIRRWVVAFGLRYAQRLRAKRPKPSLGWRPDEMFVSIGGKRMYLWRAVDAEGEVLDILVQSKRNKRAATRLMRKLIRKYGMSPSALVTDRLPSYGAAFAELGLSQTHVRGRRKNNRAQSSHVPIRRRERKAQAFRSPGSAQRFLSTHAAVYNTFNTCRHLTSAGAHRELRATAFATWREAVGVAA